MPVFADEAGGARKQGEASGQKTYDLFKYYHDYPDGLKGYVNSGADVKVKLHAVGVGDKELYITGKITSIEFNTMKMTGDNGKEYRLAIGSDANLIYPPGDMPLNIDDAKITELPKDVPKGFLTDRSNKK